MGGCLIGCLVGCLVDAMAGYDLSMSDAAPDARSNARIESLLALAIAHVNAGRLAPAKAVCALAASTHPPHPAVLQLLAMLALRDGNAPGARRYAEASLTLRPGHSPTLMLAGQAHHVGGALHAALLAFEQLTVTTPADHQAWFQIALVKQDLHDLKGAQHALQRVLQLAPQRVDALVNLGIVLQEQGQLDAALRAYGRAYVLRDETFGRIAHALAAGHVGRLWLDLDALRATLRGAAA